MSRELAPAVGANLQMRRFKGGRTNISKYPLGYGVERLESRAYDQWLIGFLGRSRQYGYCGFIG